MTIILEIFLHSSFLRKQESILYNFWIPAFARMKNIIQILHSVRNASAGFSFNVLRAGQIEAIIPVKITSRVTTT